MKKYIVIDTWNGEGYSYNNGVDTKQFDDKKKAFAWAYKRALSNVDGEKEDVHQYSDEEYFKEKPFSDGDGYYFDLRDDYGSYQVWEVKEAYAIGILCNVNEVSLFTKKEYDKAIEDLDWEIEEYCKKHKDKKWVTTDKEDLKVEEKNGDLFYNEFDDYDYQFRLITNLK